MEPIIAVIFTRSFERLTAVAIGGVCIWLGWKLFYLEGGSL